MPEVDVGGNIENMVGGSGEGDEGQEVENDESILDETMEKPGG